MQKPGDETVAMALKLAKEKLDKLGWGYANHDIGDAARKILDGLYGDDWRKSDEHN